MDSNTYLMLAISICRQFERFEFYDHYVRSIEFQVSYELQFKTNPSVDGQVLIEIDDKSRNQVVESILSIFWAKNSFTISRTHCKRIIWWNVQVWSIFHYNFYFMNYSFFIVLFFGYDFEVHLFLIYKLRPRIV